MKRLLFILLAMYALIVPIKGEAQIVEDRLLSEDRVMPKDSLPDLWIISFDMTGSMKSRQILRNMQHQENNKGYIPKMVDSIVLEYGNTSKDVFVLLEFGSSIDELLKTNSNSINYSDNELVSYLIHESGTSGGDYGSIKDRIREICSNISLFNFDMSYTSVVRPLSVNYVAKTMKFDFLRYRNVYSLLITDNGNDNDQWMSDYNWTRWRCKKHFACFMKLLPTIASSEFDFTSRKSGKFIEIQTMDVPPFYFLTQYVTYQECNPEVKLVADSIIAVSDFHNNRFTLQMKPCGDSVKFVYVSTCHVNGHPIEVNQYLYLGDTITVGFDKAFVNTFQNKVAAEGTYQEQYNDRILGQRYRTVAFRGEISDTFVSSETKAAELRCLKVALALLLAIILFIIVWRNTVVLSIYVNRRSWSVKRKAMNRLKNGDYNVVTVQCDSEMREPGFWFLLGKGFLTKLEKSKPSRSKKRDGNELQIKSNRKLAHISTEMVPDEDKNGRVFRFDFDGSNIGDEIHFSYSGRLSHNLIIKFIGRRKVEPVKCSDNLLLDYNLNMLSGYARKAFDVFDSRCKKTPKEKNHVQVNIIRKEVLGSKYDYAVLNIYDHNSRNSASHIFLRYSLACFFDRGQTAEQAATDQLIEVARYVLNSERQKASFVETKPYTEQDYAEQGMDVDVSPMLSYLYLLKKSESRLVYSPFKDGCPPLSDGRQGLVRKTVKVFHNSSMTLLNLPFIYRHPEMKVNGPTKVVYEKCFHEAECMDFLGDDRIKFLGVENDWTMGITVDTVDGPTHRSWPLDLVVDDAIKQK